MGRFTPSTASTISMSDWSTHQHVQTAPSFAACAPAGKRVVMGRGAGAGMYLTFGIAV